jgi:hypothetical protein
MAVGGSLRCHSHQALETVRKLPFAALPPDVRKGCALPEKVD